jgi:hypothetical protein
MSTSGPVDGGRVCRRKECARERRGRWQLTSFRVSPARQISDAERQVFARAIDQLADELTGISRAPRKSGIFETKLAAALVRRHRMNLIDNHGSSRPASPREPVQPDRLTLAWNMNRLRTRHEGAAPVRNAVLMA